MAWRTSRPQQQQVCRYFKAGEKCRYGNKCKFPHTNAQTTSNRPDANWDASVDDLKLWSHSVPRDQHGPPLGHALSRFFSRALTLTRKNNESMQRVVTRLATEGGLACIDEIRTNIQQSDRPGSEIFEDQLLPLLQLLSEDDVRTSLVLEAAVGSIALFVFGNAGQRAIVLFTYATQAFADEVSALRSSKSL